MLGSSVLLVADRFSIISSVLLALGTGALAVFLAGSAVALQDFCNRENEDAQNEMSAFLENLFDTGGAPGDRRARGCAEVVWGQPGCSKRNPHLN